MPSHQRVCAHWRLNSAPPLKRKEDKLGTGIDNERNEKNCEGRKGIYFGPLTNF